MIAKYLIMCTNQLCTHAYTHCTAINVKCTLAWRPFLYKGRNVCTHHQWHDESPSQSMHVSSSDFKRLIKTRVVVGIAVLVVVASASASLTLVLQLPSPSLSLLTIQFTANALSSELLSLMFRQTLIPCGCLPNKQTVAKIVWKEIKRNLCLGYILSTLAV